MFKPGIYIETYGCSLNISDSELFAGLLVEAGYEICGIDDAALIIVNTCTVKTPTENAFFKRLEELKKLDKPLVITGCIPQANSERLFEAIDGVVCSVVGTHQLSNIVEIVQATIEGKSLVLLAKENTDRLNLPLVQKNPLIHILPISKGCLGSCTYCLTKVARGDLVSYPSEEIVRQAKKAISLGAREIWITSQDNGAYGLDIGTNIVELLKEILLIKGKFLVRLGMANPNHVVEMLDELIEVFMHPKMFKFLHIPVQSGNDDVLKMMRRKYSVSDFMRIVKAFRKKIPRITIATDIICGFPTESEEQFNDSVELLHDIKPDVVNISRFWGRKGTPAYSYKQLPGSVIKERSRRITRHFENISSLNNERWVGWEGVVLVDENRLARNFYYKPVAIRMSDEMHKKLFGKFVRVKVKNHTVFHLKADLITSVTKD